MNRARVLLLGPLVAAAAVLVLAAPLTVVTASSRLAVAIVITSGAWLSVRRIGSVDLGTAAAVAAGAYGGGVLAGLVAVPPLVTLPLAGLLGALVGACSAALAARVGRALGALTSLAVVVLVGAVATGVPSAGGRAGFHAVPLLLPSERGDLAVSLLLALAAVGVLLAADASRVIAAASVAIRAPHLSASLGRQPAAAASVGGALAGALLGVGGSLDAAIGGSVLPAAYGLALSATLALAALLGGRHPVGASLGALLVLGPSIVAPTLPVLAEVPVLVTGVLGLALLAWRPAGLLGRRGPGVEVVGVRASRPPRPRREPFALHVLGLPSASGHPVELRATPGSITVVAGRNGSGKSTLLARVSGSLPDQGRVRFGERAAPRGAVARARAGLARTWQRPPVVDGTDALVTAIGDRDGAEAAWAAAVLGGQASSAAGSQLVRLAAQRPAIALLDEPAAHLDPAAVVAFLRGLADGGATVVVAEHRTPIVSAGDQVVRLDEEVAP